STSTVRGLPVRNGGDEVRCRHCGSGTCGRLPALRASLERATGRIAARGGIGVSSIVVLDDVELIPVLKFEPFRFAAQTRTSPSGIFEDMPEEWYRYWLESLADSGITGLMPIYRGSWHVPTREFSDPALLGAVLEVTFRNLSKAGFTIDLECMPLLGGLAL